MNIRPIKSDADHERALTRIEQLMHAKTETLDGEELDVLVTMVDAYESKHHSIDAPNPIAATYFRMEPQD